MKQTSLQDAPELFGDIELDSEKEWIKLAKQISWHEFEEEYATHFPSKKGQPAIGFRVVLGTLLVKERYHFSGEETVVHSTMNPYFQYFIGLEAFTQRSLFDASMLTRFRKRITPLMLAEVWRTPFSGRGKTLDFAKSTAST